MELTNSQIDELKKLPINTLIQTLSNNYTTIIPRTILKHFPKLSWGNNGIGDRWVNGKQNYTVIYSGKKGYLTYSDNEENIDIKKIINFSQETKGSGIIGIWPHSIKTENKARPIKSEISTKIKSGCCVVCGSKSQLVCDHKNDLYNDPRVLDEKTQVIQQQIYHRLIVFMINMNTVMH